MRECVERESVYERVSVCVCLHAPLSPHPGSLAK